MNYFVKPFSLDEKELIVNTGVECFNFNIIHTNYFITLKEHAGTVVPKNLVENLLDINSIYDLITAIPTLQSIRNVKVVSDIKSPLERNLNDIFNASEGQQLTIFFFKDIKNYLESLESWNDTGMAMGAFITNDQLNISHLYENRKESACLKCHFFNIIGNNSVSDNRLNKWQQFYRFFNET